MKLLTIRTKIDILFILVLYVRINRLPVNELMVMSAGQPTKGSLTLDYEDNVTFNNN